MSTDKPPTVDSKPLPSASALPFDADKYLEHTEDFEMSEAQKLEFLRTLWDIMSTFMRLGFGVEAVLPTVFQRALETPQNGLEESIPTHEFNVAADSGPADEEKE